MQGRYLRGTFGLSLPAAAAAAAAAFPVLGIRNHKQGKARQGKSKWEKCNEFCYTEQALPVGCVIQHLLR